MTRQEKWGLLTEAMSKDIPGFTVGYKEESTFQRFLGRVSFWNDYFDFTTTMYPRIWFSSREYVDENLPVETLQHEWVHLKDASTFFGWFPWMPRRVNAVMWNLAYLMPQPLALLALVGFWVDPWYLLCALFAAPWPAPFRAWAELRAYRRSVELAHKDFRAEKAVLCSDNFVGPGYYFMWPFRRWVKSRLLKPSPYQAQMDEVYLRDT